MSTIAEEKCGHCGNPLSNLFDFDLRDQRLAFLRLRGQRMRILSCPTCWSQTFSEWDVQGNARWSEHTSKGYGAGEYQGWIEKPVVLGPPARTPMEAVLGAEHSWIGGHPYWINDACYLDCPKCALPMKFVGQVDLCELGGDGILYAMICTACRMAATFGYGT